MKTLILIPLSVLGLALSTVAQNEKPPVEAATIEKSSEHQVLCRQLDLIVGKDYVIGFGAPGDKILPCYTVLSLGDRGWIKVEIKEEKNTYPRFSKPPHWINLAQVSSILKVDDR